MWRLLQTIIIVAVLFSNVYWQWTPNGYLAFIYAAGTAFVVTIALTALFDWVKAVHRGRNKDHAEQPVPQGSKGDRKLSYFE